MTHCSAIGSPVIRTALPGGPARFVGIDVGAETIKLAELLQDSDGVRPGRCRIIEHHKEPGVVLGRPYTIYNTVLNSNVPAILREQSAIGIPLDCYPVDDAMPTFKDMYWSHG